MGYQETFALVLKMNTVRILLSLATHFDWDLQLFDIKNVRLHSKIDEEIYMKVPLGFRVSLDQNKVCKLKKVLYGLKQSPIAWF